MPELKLGKKPAAPRPTDFKFTEFAASIQLPSVPSRFGHGTAYADWKVLGNDHYGNCVWAGAAHEHMLLNKVIHQADVTFDDGAVLGDYSAATGFDPNDPSTDNGTDVHDALSYRRETGIADTGGTRHLIGAYVSLDPKNWEHLEQATYIFGAVGIGFEFPASAMDQFNAGEPWVCVAGSKIEGGHYVPVVGSLQAADQAIATTENGLAACANALRLFSAPKWVETVERISGPVVHSRIQNQAERLRQYERMFRHRLAMLQIRCGNLDEAIEQWSAIEEVHCA